MPESNNSKTAIDSGSSSGSSTASSSSASSISSLTNPKANSPIPTQNTLNATQLAAQQQQQVGQVAEKPSHYTYLKGFRVEQCALFLQHKCTQHRPYTCFYWHFKNQRRRRPQRKRDGTFNYNPDIYCDKYDEQTGVCPNSDDCPYVHRNAGDTEKRYHLRYFKTATCIHETDIKGNCAKNGVHCAFAHSAADMRPPVYDIREIQIQQTQQQQPQQQIPLTNGSINNDLINEKAINLSTSLEKERLLNEDPKWNETNYVLINYKTEQCKRPPRLCRQGFACPQYHNARDKRRNPSIFKYRSTPCPNVKQGDDWLEPTVCENGDACKYCHSRTEQQFHPEIYKSSKCNDMATTGYCPRGPFCAFAHIEQELKNQRAHSTSESSSSEYTLENFISNVLPSKENEQDNSSMSGEMVNSSGTLSNTSATMSNQISLATQSSDLSISDSYQQSLLQKQNGSINFTGTVNSNQNDEFSYLGETTTNNFNSNDAVNSLNLINGQNSSNIILSGLMSSNQLLTAAMPPGTTTGGVLATASPNTQ